MFGIQNPSTSQKIKQPRSIAFTNGQIFQGRITNLYPNDVATLTMNGIQLTARMEVALTVGQRYWFEVKEASGIPRLKIIDDNIKQRESSATTSTERLRQQLDLPSTKSMSTLLRLLSRNQLPFLKEDVLKGYTILRELNQLNERGYRTIMNMIKSSIHISREAFLSFQSMEKQPSLLAQITKLYHSLEPINTPASKEVRLLIENIIKPNYTQIIQSPITQLLAKLGENEGARQLLSRLGILKRETPIQEIFQTFERNFKNPTYREIVEKLWPETSTNRDLLNMNQLIRKVNIAAGKQGMGQLQQLLQLFHSPIRAEEVYAKWLQLPQASLSQEEKNVLQTILMTATPFNIQEAPGLHLKNLFLMLGLQYENDLASFFQGDLGQESIHSNRLKALLMMLTQHDLPENVSVQVKQSLVRLTGQQLLMHEQSGAFHQYLYQLPIVLGTYSTDLTLKWEGKKDDEGKLDPKYCRVLFYLTLAHLREIIIDVHIQNRIVQIDIYNDKERPDALLSLLLPLLDKL
ncbi:hypothetical protein [Halalkalibacter krulwichiae]|uniref:Uncharacterized protein n=1 Tax=Halalkalibacter krulwichiae TaxID=199441 RepID=A0A1X9MC61_9BACI|nr:hypothetical protein [Halalkalibacter krulwichiae]ARK31017.1 hypothetical protein BkAM31D_14850 [Halalkalibacter krulwichiae]